MRIKTFINDSDTTPCMKCVPAGLRTWFLIHFAADYLVGVPLFLFPEWTLELLRLPAEPLTARLVAAALLAIGGVSFLKHTKEQYRSLLLLKIIWAGTALIGILLSLREKTSFAGWSILAVFALFLAVWIYYRRKLQ